MNPIVPFVPDNAPFTPDQRAWLNGFLAGLFSRDAAPAPMNAPSAAAVVRPLTILFGSQTGTAESLAKKAAKEAGKRGFAPTVLDMALCDIARLVSEKNLLVIASTYGDGEPPDNAKALHEALRKCHLLDDTSPERPELKNLRFSVCALGDTNYTQFCRCGRDFDDWLEKAGARRVAARVDCDVDYDAKFAAWLDAALSALGAGEKSDDSNASAIAADVQPIANPSGVAAPSKYSRTNPFSAPVVGVRCLNGAGSAKEVNHVEFSLEGSGLSYEAGDALGVVPQNCPELVDSVLAVLGCDGEEAVPVPGDNELPLRRALLEVFDLGRPTGELVATCGAAGVPNLHVIDALAARGGLALKPAELTGLLRKLQPRLYSISSSPKAHPGQVHLTVGVVRYEAYGRARKGVCSTFLAERALAGGKVGVFVHANKAFRPPVSGETPMIMVGPGTGIAPFRAFLEERRATEAKGKNWLFFGDQREATDFLYRDELLALKEAGVLTRLDLAWSRDQAKKVYVQDRMVENAAEVFEWLEAGAHFYVCGDASRMAKDVEAALHRIIESAGGKSPDEAAAYVQALRAAKRYQRDVY